MHSSSMALLHIKIPVPLKRWIDENSLKIVFCPTNRLAFEIKFAPILICPKMLFMNTGLMSRERLELQKGKTLLISGVQTPLTSLYIVCIDIIVASRSGENSLAVIFL